MQQFYARQVISVQSRQNYPPQVVASARSRSEEHRQSPADMHHIQSCRQRKCCVCGGCGSAPWWPLRAMLFRCWTPHPGRSRAVTLGVRQTTQCTRCYFVGTPCAQAWPPESWHTAQHHAWGHDRRASVWTSQWAHLSTPPEKATTLSPLLEPPLGGGDTNVPQNSRVSDGTSWAEQRLQAWCVRTPEWQPEPWRAAS